MEYNNRTKGTRYEDIAISYLVKKGHKILKRNYRNHYGEIDIISVADDTLVFTECKYRKSDRYGDPLEAVGPVKQLKISKTAAYYYAGHSFAREMTCRFDVIAIYGDGTIKHIEDAFEFRGNL